MHVSTYAQFDGPATNIVIAFTAHRVEWHIAESDEFEPIKHVATVRGKSRYLLLGERVTLNLLARCSGICYRICLVGLLLVVEKLTRRVAAPNISRTWHRAMASAAPSQEHARQRLVCIRHCAARVTCLNFCLGFKLVEMYGMLVGGIDPHRFDLSSMIMLKGNHIWSAGKASHLVYLYLATLSLTA